MPRAKKVRTLAVMLITLLASSIRAEPGTPEEREVNRECSTTASEHLKELREFAQKIAETRSSHGRAITETRAWLKNRQLEDQVPDKCVAAVVRAVITDQYDKEVLARAKRREEDEAKNKEKWIELNDLERRWVLFRRSVGKDLPSLGCKTAKVGAMGYLDGALEVGDIVSKSDVIVDFDCEDSLLRVSAWLSGIDTSNLVDDKRIKGPSGLFWVPRTITYPTAIGGTRTIYYIERANVDAEKTKNVVPPSGARLEEPPPSESPPPERPSNVGRIGGGMRILEKGEIPSKP